MRQRENGHSFGDGSAGINVSTPGAQNRVGAQQPTVIVTTPQALAGLVRDAVSEALCDTRQNAGPLLLDRTSAARVLGIGTSSVDRFRKAGMPCVWVGDTPRFIVDECLGWLREHRREPQESE